MSAERPILNETPEQKERRETCLRQIRAFRLNPDGGDPIPIPPPTEEQQRSIDEQVKRMFTPDGQSRRVIQLREAWRAAQSKPDIGFTDC